MKKKNWEDFRSSGMLWWANKSLHVFGWAIACKIEEGEIVEVFPIRTRFRGFDEKTNEEGYIKISEYMKNNAEQLEKESKGDW